MGKKYDFGGWATRNNLLCSDGRTIRKDAFRDCDGQTVPLVYNHDHSDINRVLGHALLENRDEGVYAYCSFNDTETGRHAKETVKHGDLRSLSIYANKLKHVGSDVIHGCIREVSLVLAGANPGAYVDFVMAHGEDGEDALIANYDECYQVIYHAEESTETTETKKEEQSMATEANNNEKTIKEIYDEMTDEQKTVVHVLVGMAKEGDDEDEDEEMNHSDEGGYTMKRNVFDQEEPQVNYLTHADEEAIITGAKRYGSLKESFLAHAGDVEYAEETQNYGINGTDFLFPEAHNLNTPPEFIKRDTGWVAKVMSGVHHTPFSRIKSMFADITEDEARAKGYIKGKLKKEEVFSLLKRTTTPTTIYKKQKMDRDDVVDITDFDVIAWLKREMRMMLDEEIARAVLIGDGRLASDDDHINESNIRPILKDEDLFTIKANVTVASTATDNEKGKAIIRGIIKSRKNYKGSGEPTFFTTEDVLTDLLLIEDMNGRIIYDSLEKLKSVLRVKEIVTVPVMEGLKNEDGSEVIGVIVNLKDYNVGADKGGAVNLFDDFDIDYNAMKYLIETRCSGALVKPYSAIAVSLKSEAAAG